ncbi:hypothetical protein M408DRAFT_281934 [Serendipita vermifera MAFF 305830]|uniref:Uncharacterized protein n=1 Tax=Serendipita vermifera MAFF 305830 TaxID=933852 RepID=A0A0C2W8F2_SERVB|nr:hypothetical protein M408DRAFT_281934 [Serendipita vermifera MAFF 305830]
MNRPTSPFKPYFFVPLPSPPPPYPLPVRRKSTGIQPSFASNPAVPASGTYEESGNGLRDERKERGIDPGSYEESEDMGGGRAVALNTHSGRRMVYSVAGTVGGRRWIRGIEKSLYGLMLPVIVMIPRKPPMLSPTSPIS